MHIPRALRLEDLGLAAWNAVGIPVVASSASGPVVRLGEEPHLLAGVIQLLAAAGAIVAIGGIAFVAGSSSTYLGAELDGLITGTAFLAAVAAISFSDHLPVLASQIRRLIVLPFILVSAGIFNGFAADILQGFDPALLSLSSFSAEGGLILFIGLMLLGGLAAFYAALVAAPRALADPEHAGFVPIGFVVYVLSALLGIGWLAGATFAP
jgi:hypothetical protein